MRGKSLETVEILSDGSRRKNIFRNEMSVWRNMALRNKGARFVS